MSRVGAKSVPVAPIIKAIGEGSLAKVKKALKDDSKSVNCKNAEGRTPLHLAVDAKQLPVMRLLLSKKADVNAVDPDGWSSLHIAANNGSLDICQELLKTKDIDINARTIDGTTAFCYLVRTKGGQINDDWKLYKRVLKAMLLKKADVNAFTGSGESPLQQACLKGTIVSVDFLLSNNVEVNSLNAKKETALHWVVMRKRLPMVEALMKHGADPYFASPGMPTPMEVALADPTMRDIVSAMKSKSLACGEALHRCKNSGFMFLYKRPNWERVYCVLKGRILFVFRTDSPDAKPQLALDMIAHSVAVDLPDKERREAEFPLKLSEAECASNLFKADSEVNRRAWVTAFETVRVDLIMNGHAMEQQGENEEINEDLVRLLDVTDNQFCADCGGDGAFWLLRAYGALVCYDCAELHVELRTTPLRSIHFDVWTMDDTMILKCNGNRRHNEKFEAVLSLSVSRPRYATAAGPKRHFIQQKYCECTFQTKNVVISPRSLDMRQALALRVEQYPILYRPDILIESLPISSALWKHLCSTSAIFTNLEVASMEAKGPQFDQVLAALLDSKTPGVSSPLKCVLSDFLMISRRMGASKESWGTRELKCSLLRILDGYEKLQTGAKDRHLSLIFQWWLPQAVEILSIVQADYERNDLTLLLSHFHRNCTVAMYLLSGEYLLLAVGDRVTAPATTDANTLRAKAGEIRTQCQKITQSVRAMMSASRKRLVPVKKEINREEPRGRAESFSSAGRTESFSSVGRTKSTDLRLSQLARFNSFGNDSSDAESHPKETVTNEERHPLMSLSQIAPNGLSAMLCSVISELPLQAQSNLLGIMCSGHQILPCKHDYPWEDVFHRAQQDLGKLVLIIVNTLEAIRAQWPQRTALAPLLEQNSLFRQIHLLHTQVTHCSGLPVSWSNPELWDAWHCLQMVLEEAAAFFLEAAQANQTLSVVASTLCLLIVQVKWTHSKLCEIQAQDGQ